MKKFNEYLKKQAFTFKHVKGFEYERYNINGEKIEFLKKHKNMKLMGLASSIRSQVKRHIPDFALLPKYSSWLRAENFYVYNVESQISCFQYDLTMAYPSVLRILWLSDATYQKMKEVKYKFGFNVNEAIGMALLGEKIITEYRNGREINKILDANPYRTVFFLIRFLVIETIRRLLRNEFPNSRLAYYVDSFILTNQASLIQINTSFITNFCNLIDELEKKAVKYYNESFVDAFGICVEKVNHLYKNYLNNELIKFKVEQIDSVRVVKNELTGVRGLSFMRDGKVVKYGITSNIVKL